MKKKPAFTVCLRTASGEVTPIESQDPSSSSIASRRPWKAPLPVWTLELEPLGSRPNDAASRMHFCRSGIASYPRRDVAALAKVLAEDIEMGAPPYWAKLQGRDLVRHLLGLIVHTIEDFTYHREWCSGLEYALEFTGHVGDQELQGIDLISLNERGEISNLDVLMRPVTGVIALREIIAPQMAAYLAQRTEDPTST